MTTTTVENPNYARLCDTCRHVPDRDGGEEVVQLEFDGGRITDRRWRP